MASSKIDYAACIHKYNVPLEAMVSCLKARRWAKKILSEKEGSGHEYSFYKNTDGTISCFTRLTGKSRVVEGKSKFGSLAMVLSVIKYLEGCGV